MRASLVVVGGALWCLGCGPVGSPCVPIGAHDFFMVRPTGCGPMSGTFDITGERDATLTLEEGTRQCTVTLSQDNRKDPLAACQVQWSCVPSGACAGCGRMGLSVLYLPADDGVIPAGMAVLSGSTCSPGTWSAARRSP